MVLLLPAPISSVRKLVAGVLKLAHARFDDAPILLRVDLGELVRRDIANGADNVLDLALGARNRFRVAQDPTHLASRRDHAMLHAVLAMQLEHVVDRFLNVIGDPFAVLGMHEEDSAQ